MSTTEWRKAAQLYREQATAGKGAQNPQHITSAPLRVEGDSLAAISVVLTFFIESEEGRAAQEMLRAADRHIVIAEENEGGGIGVVYFFDGDGFKRSTEAMGTWMAYSRPENIPKPVISWVSTDEVARVVLSASRGTATADEVMRRLREGLDRVAHKVTRS
jgi:hypothetical protein